MSMIVADFRLLTEIDLINHVRTQQISIREFTDSPKRNDERFFSFLLLSLNLFVLSSFFFFFFSLFLVKINFMKNIYKTIDWWWYEVKRWGNNWKLNAIGLGKYWKEIRRSVISEAVWRPERSIYIEYKKWIAIDF